MPASQASSTSTLVYDIRQNRYLNITGRCTLKCAFCPKQQGCTSVHQYQLSLEREPTVAELLPLLGNVTDFDEYVFCGYGEPTLNLETLLGVAKVIKAQGGQVRVNTDGLGSLFHKRNILPELANCVDALSVSLNAQDEATYIKHCQPRLKGSWQAVNAFIREAPLHIAKVEVSAIDGLAGVDIDACRQLVTAAGCEFKYRKLDVVG